MIILEQCLEKERNKTESDAVKENKISFKDGFSILLADRFISSKRVSIG